jgi:hypothetical protein
VAFFSSKSGVFAQLFWWFQWFFCTRDYSLLLQSRIQTHFAHRSVLPATGVTLGLSISNGVIGGVVGCLQLWGEHDWKKYA